jgi:uncharacterized membrane protein YccC
LGPVTILQWLRTRDAGLSALRRTIRAAIIMPSLFAVGVEVIGNPTMAVFATFGSFAMLLFVDFGGPMRERLLAQASLVLTGAALVCLGTLAAQAVWLAVVSVLVIGFLVLFAGIVSSVLAGATTALLASFILPVTQLGPLSSLPDRLAGWVLAGVVSMAAISLLWPAPTREPLRTATAQACALLARRLRAEVDCVREGFDPETLAKEASDAVAALRTSFFSTPHRPTGLTTAARTLVRLIDEVIWLDSILGRTPIDRRQSPTNDAVCTVKLAAAILLEHGASLLESADDTELEPDLRRLRAAREAMEQAVTSTLPVHHSSAASATEFVTSLEPSFRAQEMSVAISAISENIELNVAARRRTWWQQLWGSRPEAVGSALSSAQERAGAHVERHSVWLHNSVRGAIALGAAVLVADLASVHQSFWVVFGTLAVLRSNALNTGATALRALLGTMVGIVIGSALIFAIGSNTTVFWILLPLAVVFAGLAPAAVSFTAGQAGFTIALLILFSIIQPAGLAIGVARIEDVAIGSAVSLVVGVLFWPRGAGSALRQALSEALSDSVRYLRGAVEYGVSRCDALVSVASTPTDEARRAAAAARRLDDAFRGFLAERGTKHISLANVTTLVTAVAVIRLTAEAVLDLWRQDESSLTGDRAAARAEVLTTGTTLLDWYEQTASALAGSGQVPEPLHHDKAADGRLIEAVRRDLNGEGTATAVKMIWTADHLDAIRRLQPVLAGPAAAAAATGRSWTR